MLVGPFTTSETLRLTGFRSGAMLGYLARSELIVPSIRPQPGRGRTKLYSFGDVVLLRAINRVLESGIPVSRLKTALQRLRISFRDLRTDTALQRYLITDGRDIFLEEEPGRLVNLNAEGQMTFAFIIDIRKAQSDVTKRVEELGLSKQRKLHSR